MKVYSRFKKRPTETTPAGSKEEPNYKVVLNERGEKVIVQDGVTNIYDLIQEDKDACDIEKIVKRAMNNPELLNQRAGMYADVTEMPTTLAEAQNFVIQATANFEKLPIDTRRKFNMSAEQYIAAYGTDYWIEAMGLKKGVANEQGNTGTLQSGASNTDSEV